MMTSQDRICVQCVTDGLQLNEHWVFTNQNILLNIRIHVVSVEKVIPVRFA